MQGYVINLARSADRRAHMKTEMATAGISYEMVEGVDGRTLNLADTELFDPATVARFRPGMFGCALSHLKVYRKILNDGLDNALVLEDDVVLPMDLSSMLDQIALELVGAEVVLLNFHSDGPCEITNTGSIPLGGSRLLVRPLERSHPSSTGAYVITREACMRLVNWLLPIRAHADEWTLFYREKLIDRVRCVTPMPVFNSALFRTTNDYYKPGSLQLRLRESIASRRTPILHQALTLRRHLRFRREGMGQVQLADDISDRAGSFILWRGE